MTIQHTSTIAEIANAIPSSIRVFQRYGIDFCCGGRRQLGAACQQQGVAFEEVAAAIEHSSQETPDDRDWTREPLDTLIDHIVSAFHEPLREELPRLKTMAAKVAAVHGERTPFLRRIAAIVDDLSADLLHHMLKEEHVLFPAIQRAMTGEGIPLEGPIHVMEHEHDRAGACLAELRDITNEYWAPEHACQTWRALYAGLAELEDTMHVHVHLENNVLFPRALRWRRRR